MKVMAMLVAVCCVFATLTTGSGPITVGETRITNDYPETVAFEVEATSTAATITSVEFDAAFFDGKLWVYLPLILHRCTGDCAVTEPAFHRRCSNHPLR